MKWDKIIGRIGELLMLLAAVGLAWVIFYAIPKAFYRDVKARDNTQIGCEFLGHPRDLNTVYFYDCDGEVIMKRVK